MNKIVYKNLGANSGERMIYIRSTDIEQKRWDKLLLSFTDEALFHMTMGRKIVIEDKCCKKYGKIQRIFAPALTDFLRWLVGLRPLHNNLKDHLQMAIMAYSENKIVKAKYDFFKKKLNNYTVRGRTIYMKHEPTVWKKL